ncbi:hypothetical protein [Nonomuraea dietziae]|uniref:hypothetical protein n=1 Tax=Nonomuraea dietziae TaxID=65515 RepID=UPI003428B57C
MKNINEAADGKYQVDPDADDAGLGDPGDSTGDVLPEAKLCSQPVPGLCVVGVGRAPAFAPPRPRLVVIGDRKLRR